MNDSAKERPKRPHVAELDGLRAIAITMVIVSHIVDGSVHPILASLGYLGVAIFFALSGYLITSHLVDEYEQTGRIFLRQFYVRRFFRILPPAFFYLAVVAILAKFGIVNCDWSAIKAALFFYANYREDYYRIGWMIGHFWSLSVEEHFYFMWPTVLMLFGVLNGWRTASIMALSISVLRILDDRYHFIGLALHNPSLGHFHSDLVSDVILWGCCLAYFIRSNRRDAGSPTLWTIVTLTGFFMMLAPTLFEIHHVTIPAHMLPAVILGSVLISPNAPIARCLRLAPLRFVGRLSYSIYLWQTLFLGGPEPHMYIPFALAAILGCAYLSFTCIERPSIRMGRQAIQRRVTMLARAET